MESPESVIRKIEIPKPLEEFFPVIFMNHRAVSDLLWNSSLHVSPGIYPRFQRIQAIGKEIFNEAEYVVFDFEIAFGWFYTF